MSGVFRIAGGAIDRIRTKLNSTSPVDVAGSADRPTPVMWFQCTEISGNTPNLTIAIYNATTTSTYYLRNAKAMTAKEEILFEAGIRLEKNEFLRITASAANQVDVVGQTILTQT